MDGIVSDKNKYLRKSNELEDKNKELFNINKDLENKMQKILEESKIFQKE